jgi:hypothetical protein
MDKPGTNLEDLLDDEHLPQAIQNATPEFVEFCSKPEILNSLIEWGLTTKKQKLPAFRRYASVVMEMLTSDFGGFLTKQVESGFMLKTMRDFIASKYGDDPMTAGHFQRIVESLGRLTFGKFIRDFTELGHYLFTNIHNLALRELFIVLAIDFKESFKFTTEKIKIICSKLPEITGQYYVVSSFRVIVRSTPTLYALFNEQSIIENLLELGVTTNYPVLAFEIFSFLLGLRKVYPEIAEIIKKYDGRYKFDPKKKNCATAAALSLFSSGVPLFIDEFFEYPAHTIIDGAILRSISLISDEKLVEIIRSHKLPEKIIENFGKSKTNGQLTCLAEYLASKGPICPELETKEWKEFIETKLADKLIIRDSPYGGQVKSCFSTYEDHAVYIDHDYDAKEENQDFNEEEVFSDGASSGDNNYEYEGDYDDEPIESGASNAMSKTTGEGEEPAFCRSFVHRSPEPNADKK